MSLNAGDRIGDYEILGTPAASGQGDLYRVRQTGGSRIEVARVVPLDPSGGPELLDKLQSEIRPHADLDHPNIAKIGKVFPEGNALVVVTETAAGETLATRLGSGRMPLSEGLSHARQILSALDYMHGRNLVHGGIDPAQIMLRPDGVLKLMNTGAGVLAKHGAVPVTPHYVSPEQAGGGAPDARSDFYVLGLVLYEMLTGKRPFDGGQETPPPPADVAPDIPDQLSDIVMMALSSDPAQRFQTARAFQNALGVAAPPPEAPAQAVAGIAATVPPAAAATPTPPSPHAPPPPPPTGGSGKPGSGMRLVYMLAGALAVIVVAALAVTQIPKWRSAQAEPGTEQAVEMPAATTAQQVAEPPADPAGEDTPRQAVAQTPPSTPAAPAPDPPAKSATTTAAPGPPPRVPEGGMPPIEQTTGFLDAQAAAKDQREAEAALHAALDELDERQVLMGARISAVQSALTQLEREQSRMGVSLRGDMAAARQLLQTRMSQASAALDAGNVDNAKKYLDQAEHALRKLEGFLNL